MNDETRSHWEQAVNRAAVALRRRQLAAEYGGAAGAKGLVGTGEASDEQLQEEIQHGLAQLNEEGLHYRWKPGRLETDLPAGRWHPITSRNLRIDPGVRGLLQAADHTGRERGAEKLTLDDIIAAWPLYSQDPGRWPTSGRHLPFTQPLAHAHIVGSAEEAAMDTLQELHPIHLYLACLRLSGDPRYEKERREWERELVRSGYLSLRGGDEGG